MHGGWVLLAAMLLSSEVAFGQSEAMVSIVSIAPQVAERGETVVVTGAHLKTAGASISRVEICAGEGDCKDAQLVDVTDTTVKFVVPDVSVGRSKVLLYRSDNQTPRQAPNLSVAPAKIELTGIDPATSFPAAGNGTFDATLLGSGFSTGDHIKENVINFAEKRELHLCLRSDADTDCEGKARVDENLSDDRALVLTGIPAEYSGIRKVSVRIGPRVSNIEKLTLSRVGRFLPLVTSLLLSFLIFAIILGSFYYFGMARTTTGGRKLGFVEGLLLDEDTYTYSLSKAQFYIWIVVTVLGYIYLTTARSMVQGQIELSDIPQNLASILGVSVGTGVLAIGVSNAKGGKGSGDTTPRLSDFITSGGVIAPERLQFLIWTIISAVGFLALTYSISPAAIAELPKIPDGVLLLSGVSAAGYIGGKVARTAGPNLTGVSAALSNGDKDLVLTLTGTKLPKTGVYFIDTTQLSPNELPPANVKIDAYDPPEDATSEFATSIGLTVVNLPPTLLTGPHTLTVLNRSGEKSAYDFSVAPIPNLTGVSAALSNGNKDLTLTLAGTKLPKEGTYFIDATPLSPNELPTANVTVNAFDPPGDATSEFATSIGLTVVNLPPTLLTGLHTLTVQSPSGDKCVYDFSVGPIPTLTGVSAALSNGNKDLTLTLAGTKLPKEGTYFIDATQLSPNELPTANVTVNAFDPPGSATSEFATSIGLTVVNLPPTLLTGQHTITVQNASGGKSAFGFTLP